MMKCDARARPDVVMGAGDSAEPEIILLSLATRPNQTENGSYMNGAPWVGGGGPRAACALMVGRRCCCRATTSTT